MPNRHKREDAKVGNTRRAIAKMLDLPSSAVLLVLPGPERRRANESKKLKDLRKDWGR